MRGKRRCKKCVAYKKPPFRHGMCNLCYTKMLNNRTRHPLGERIMRTYFVLGVKTGLVKIGRTTCAVKTRLTAMQIGSPDALRLLAVIDADVEGWFHREFACYRKHGEWFELPLDVVQAIENKENAVVDSISGIA